MMMMMMTSQAKPSRGQGTRHTAQGTRRKETASCDGCKVNALTGCDRYLLQQRQGPFFKKNSFI
jgi:hypothetical protein